MVWAVLGWSVPHPPDRSSALARAARAAVDKAEARVFDSCWKEVLVEDAKGKTDDPSKLFGYEFGEDSYGAWGLRSGELSLGRTEEGRVRVRADVDPMRFDIRSTATGKENVLPCIFKFDGDKLVLVEPAGRPYVRYRADGNYPERPTGFEVTEKNGYVRRTLVPCKVFDQK